MSTHAEVFWSKLLNARTTATTLSLQQKVLTGSSGISRPGLLNLDYIVLRIQLETQRPSSHLHYTCLISA